MTKKRRRRKKQSMWEYFQIGVVLAIICVLAASALAYTYSVTLRRINEQHKRDLICALPNILPNAENFSSEKEQNDLNYFIGYKGGKIVGYAIRGTIQGYQSKIKYMIGLSTDGVIEGLIILGHGETPGLGARITELRNDQTLFGFIKKILHGHNADNASEKVVQPWFTAMFKGKSYADLSLNTDDKNSISAITGATITSRSIVNGVKEQSKQFFELLKKDENADD